MSKHHGRAATSTPTSSKLVAGVSTNVKLRGNMGNRVGSSALSMLMLPVVLVALGTTLVACGVPAQPNAQTIKSDRISLAVRQPERSVTTFVLAGGSRLYGRPDCIPLTLDLKRSAQAVLAKLRQPLSAADSVDYKSSVNAYDLSIDSVDGTGTVFVQVEKAKDFKRDLLAIGQVVLSLSSIKGIAKVGLMEGSQPLASVTVGGSNDTTGIKNGELALPTTKESFDVVESSLLRFYFFENNPAGGVRLRLGNKYVIGFETNDLRTNQLNKYLAELELGPSVETAAEKLTRERFAVVGAQVDQTDDAGPLKLTASHEFDLLSPTDQAAALGQLLLTLELIPSFLDLPPVEFYVNSEQPKSSASQRRTRVPNANGVIVDRETLSPRDYDTLVAPSPKEFASSRECR
jgi:hypothetical protein